MWQMGENSTFFVGQKVQGRKRYIEGEWCSDSAFRNRGRNGRGKEKVFPLPSFFSPFVHPSLSFHPGKIGGSGLWKEKEEEDRG